LRSDYFTDNHRRQAKPLFFRQTLIFGEGKRRGKAKKVRKKGEKREGAGATPHMTYLHDAPGYFDQLNVSSLSRRTVLFKAHSAFHPSGVGK